jgi:release factor glutamine methyltransferase
MNEAELLFTDILNCDRLSLYLNRDLKLGKDKTRLISSALKRRLLNEPIQYILSNAEFMGLSFKVTPDVFIPRPETEILVETVTELASGIRGEASGINILELGTGSGCIAVSLAKYLPDVKITATDISQEALAVAKENALLNKVSERINFIQNNLFPRYSVLYNMIVSNPPYIATGEIDNLQPEVGYEPRLALDGGEDGLDFYRCIIALAPDFLKQGGFLIMEMGFNQKRAVERIFKNSVGFQILKVIKDYNNINRVIVAQKI